MLQGAPTGLAPRPVVMIFTIRAYLANSPGAREQAGEMAHCQHPSFRLCSRAQGGRGAGCGGHGEAQAGAEIRRH